jgi:hypothetical protein
MKPAIIASLFAVGVLGAPISDLDAFNYHNNINNAATTDSFNYSNNIDNAATIVVDGGKQNIRSNI